MRNHFIQFKSFQALTVLTALFASFTAKADSCGGFEIPSGSTLIATCTLDPSSDQGKASEIATQAEICLEKRNDGSEYSIAGRVNGVPMAGVYYGFVSGDSQHVANVNDDAKTISIHDNFRGKFDMPASLGDIIYSGNSISVQTYEPKEFIGIPEGKSLFNQFKANCKASDVK